MSNERCGVMWYDRQDQHCYHENGEQVVCCWCGEQTLGDHAQGNHGPHSPKVTE